MFMYLKQQNNKIDWRLKTILFQPPLKWRFDVTRHTLHISQTPLSMTTIHAICKKILQYWTKLLQKINTYMVKSSSTPP